MFPTNLLLHYIIVYRKYAASYLSHYGHYTPTPTVQLSENHFLHSRNWSQHSLCVREFQADDIQYFWSVRICEIFNIIMELHFTVCLSCYIYYIYHFVTTCEANRQSRCLREIEPFSSLYQNISAQKLHYYRYSFATETDQHKPTFY